MEAVKSMDQEEMINSAMAGEAGPGIARHLSRAVSEPRPGAPRALTDAELRCIEQYKLVGSCNMPEWEIDKIIEAYVMHGISPRNMRKMGITRRSEYYINKCLTNAGVMRPSVDRPDGHRSARDVLVEFERRLQALEDVIQKLVQPAGAGAPAGNDGQANG